MTETLVPKRQTTLRAGDVYEALSSAWMALLGSAPERVQVLTLLAQVWHETGNGLQSNNYALAGIKHVHGDGHQFSAYLTFEDDAAGRRVILEQDFRAYSSLEESTADYLRLMRGSRYLPVWPAIEAADLDAFAHGLKVHGWYTAPEHEYAAALRRAFELLDRTLPPNTAPSTPVAIAEATALASGRPAYVAPEPELTAPDDLPPPDDEPV